jgi:hypothetical protein
MFFTSVFVPHFLHHPQLTVFTVLSSHLVLIFFKYFLYSLCVFCFSSFCILLLWSNFTSMLSHSLYNNSLLWSFTSGQLSAKSQEPSSTKFFHISYFLLCLNFGQNRSEISHHRKQIVSFQVSYFLSAIRNTLLPCFEFPLSTILCQYFIALHSVFHLLMSLPVVWVWKLVCHIKKNVRWRGLRDENILT